MKRKVSYIVFALLFISSMNAQKGFRIGASLGLATGDSHEYYSYTLQGDFYYLWNICENIDLGLTTGVIAFLGEGNNINGSNSAFGSIPDLYIPIAIAGRISLSSAFSIGSDIGYGISANAFDADGLSDEAGGFYFRPIVMYNLKEKLALIASYVYINESGGNASTISFGVNFGF